MYFFHTYSKYLRAPELKIGFFDKEEHGINEKLCYM